MDMELISVWNFDMLPKTRTESIQWAQEQGLLENTKKCTRHKFPMALYRKYGVAGEFRCNRSKSSSYRLCPKRCVMKDTFFEHCGISLYRAIRLMYAFAHDWSVERVQHEIIDLSSEDEEVMVLSHDTIYRWYCHCREIVVDHFSRWAIGDEMIGGPGTAVQIDESRFGERKRERGKNLNNHWALFMIEKDSENVRVAITENGNANTILQNILKHVKSGTVIYTDHWESFDVLEDAGYIHKRLYNTDLENRLKAPIRDNNSEGMDILWNSFRAWFHRRRAGLFADFLCLFLWRKYCEKYCIDPFQSLLQAIRDSPSYKP